VKPATTRCTKRSTTGFSPGPCSRVEVLQGEGHLERQAFTPSAPVAAERHAAPTGGADADQQHHSRFEAGDVEDDEVGLDDTTHGLAQGGGARQRRRDRHRDLTHARGIEPFGKRPGRARHELDAIPAVAERIPHPRVRITRRAVRVGGAMSDVDHRCRNQVVERPRRWRRRLVLRGDDEAVQLVRIERTPDGRERGGRLPREDRRAQDPIRIGGRLAVAQSRGLDLEMRRRRDLLTLILDAEEALLQRRRLAIREDVGQRLREHADRPALRPLREHVTNLARGAAEEPDEPLVGGRADAAVVAPGTSALGRRLVLDRPARVDDEDDQPMLPRQGRAQVGRNPQVLPPGHPIPIGASRDDAILVAEQHPVAAEVDHVDVVIATPAAELLDGVDQRVGGPGDVPRHHRGLVAAARQRRLDELDVGRDRGQRAETVAVLRRADEKRPPATHAWSQSRR
jgi:hypothetical protein